MAIRIQEHHPIFEAEVNPRLEDGEESDDAVLAARAAGDPAAFAPLYARYVRPIYRYCYRRLGTHEAAEDATSQVFAKVLAVRHPDLVERLVLVWLAHLVEGASR